jgi:hypothetical protein
MTETNNCPAALAGARRAEVTMLIGKDNFHTDTPVLMDLQVRRLLTRYTLSVPLATVVAELAFTSGRAGR